MKVLLTDTRYVARSLQTQQYYGEESPKGIAVWDTPGQAARFLPCPERWELDKVTVTVTTTASRLACSQRVADIRKRHPHDNKACDMCFLLSELEALLETS